MLELLKQVLTGVLLIVGTYNVSMWVLGFLLIKFKNKNKPLTKY